MAYNFYNIDGFDPGAYPVYFFDANVWIAALKTSASLIPKNHEKQYVVFFDSVVNLALNTDPKALSHLRKQGRHQPKIVMTSLLMSEIFNAYMRQVALKIYSEEKGKIFDYKKDYRKTEDHNKRLKRLKSDFLTFKDYWQIMDDKFSYLTPEMICSQLSSDSDFNDQYYYHLLVDESIPIVTNDGDFIFQDIPILTGNPLLLKKFNKTV